MKNIGNFLKILWVSPIVQNQYNKAILCFNWKTKNCQVQKRLWNFAYVTLWANQHFLEYSGEYCNEYGAWIATRSIALTYTHWNFLRFFSSLMSLRKAFVLLLKCVKRKPLIHFKESLASDIMFAICWWEINDK